MNHPQPNETPVLRRFKQPFLVLGMLFTHARSREEVDARVGDFESSFHTQAALVREGMREPESLEGIVLESVTGTDEVINLLTQIRLFCDLRRIDYHECERVSYQYYLLEKEEVRNGVPIDETNETG